MNKEYIVRKNSAVEVLNNIESFIVNIEKIMAKKPEVSYTYNINIIKNDDKPKWTIELNLKRNEP